ncbi:hypothetical protein ACX07_22520, partial [Vibrio parahaemolyticus]|uniref:hypothetical protein n=2 Tax=Vibrio parahaemolyticus TaxID=670 RepID=UPI0006C66296
GVRLYFRSVFLSFGSDIKGDLESIQEAWKKSSVVGKSVYLLSLFLSCSAITSISDKVFGWKGFIQDGVNFYREVSSQVISIINEMFDFSVAQHELDLLVVLGLGVFAVIRKCMVGSNSEFGVIGTFGLYVLFLLLSFNLFKVLGLTSQENINYGLTAAVIAILTLPYKRSHTKKENIVYYISILLPVMIMLVLAGINAGLERTI